jgi:flavodoxin
MVVAYYSRSGNNFLNGNIVRLTIGNTEVIAKKIQGITGCDIHKIRTVRTYPDDYTEMTEVAQEEKRSNARPELSERMEDMNGYETIIIGYPNWWGTMPMAMFTFLESYDLSGKTIAPYCTHEGSGMGGSERDINRLCPKAKVLSGLAIRGGDVGRADQGITDWLEKLGLKP